MQPPAQAGNIFTRALSPTETIDLSDTFVVGSGTVYAGGATTSTGTATKAVEGPVAAESKTPTRPAPDLSSQVALADPDWTCPWPHQADDAQIDEQVAIVKVTIGADGRCEAVSIVQDPGFGFGTHAARCAQAAEFVPARDKNGSPVRSVSAIRVRFTR